LGFFESILEIDFEVFAANRAPGTSCGETDAPLVVGDGGEKIGHGRERGIEREDLFGQRNKMSNLERKGIDETATTIFLPFRHEENRIRNHARPVVGF
jgi:hypothetical protein